MAIAFFPELVLLRAQSATALSAILVKILVSNVNRVLKKLTHLCARLARRLLRVQSAIALSAMMAEILVSSVNRVFNLLTAAFAQFVSPRRFLAMMAALETTCKF